MGVQGIDSCVSVWLGVRSRVTLNTTPVDLLDRSDRQVDILDVRLGFKRGCNMFNSVLSTKHRLEVQHFMHNDVCGFRSWLG